MSNARLTISVHQLLETANTMLAGGHEDKYSDFLGDLTPAQAFRMGLSALLEEALRESNNYAGYNHQEGIVDHSDPEKPVILDDSRRVYHKSKLLLKHNS